MSLKQKVCTEYRCAAPTHALGLCADRYEERDARQRRHARAARVLHYQKIPPRLDSLEGTHLAVEIEWIRTVWALYCSSVNYRYPCVLSHEEHVARDACVAYATRILCQIDELHSEGKLIGALIVRECGLQKLLGAVG